MNGFLNVYVYVDILTIIALFVLCVFALIHGGWRRYSNRIFALFGLVLAVWIVSNHISNETNLSPHMALVANSVVFPASFATGILLMLFIAELVSMRRIRKLIRRVQIPLWVICLLSGTPLVVGGVAVQDNVYAVEFGPLTALYAAGILFVVVMIIYLAIIGPRHTDGVTRAQLSTIRLSLCVTVPLVALFAFIIPALTGLFGFTEFALLPFVVLVVAMYHAAIRHRLFDIRLAAVRTIVYVLALATLGAFYYFLAYVVSVTLFSGHISDTVSLSPMNVALALVLAFVFQPVKNFFDKVTNSLFYRDQYNAEEFFALLSSVLSTTPDLKSLLEGAADVIQTTLKSRQAFFFVRFRGQAHLEHVVAGTARHDILAVHEASVLDRLFARTHRGTLITSELTREHAAVAVLRRRGIELVLPLWHDGVIMGYLALGESLASKYTRRDIRVLETIADELVIAIQNSMSLEAVREVNAHLQERIDGATRDLRSKNEKLKRLDDTKDEFISMASHQLRTPLTSVKGYVSMILDGDAGPINEMQRKFLTEAFESSNRMAGIIGDFLNVSRLQTGKFGLERESICLADVVASEVEHLENTAGARGLKLVYRRPATFPEMMLDKSKIEQVIMNFIDNAIFYAPNTGTVDIELFQRSGRAVFTVRDHGIGVPKSEQGNLFGKFFRATNARRKRPDGTGVGLFLAKKVIVAHKGTVIFDSVEGKGSTFGFEIPISTPVAP